MKVKCSLNLAGLVIVLIDDVEMNGKLRFQIVPNSLLPKIEEDDPGGAYPPVHTPRKRPHRVRRSPECQADLHADEALSADATLVHAHT